MLSRYIVINSKQKHLQIDFLNHNQYFPGEGEGKGLRIIQKIHGVQVCFSKTVNKIARSIYIYAIIQLIAGGLWTLVDR